MVIPVPEAESNIAYYESIYPGEFKMPKQLIHIQRKYKNRMCKPVPKTVFNLGLKEFIKQLLSYH